jgi:hypothetical protein
MNLGLFRDGTWVFGVGSCLKWDVARVFHVERFRGLEEPGLFHVEQPVKGGAPHWTKPERGPTLDDRCRGAGSEYSR